MKLVTPQGQLDLPEDFSLTIEKNNPFLSPDGDVSLPITLPPTDRNLAIFDHIERIDRAYSYTNKVDAILYVGPIQKRGQLVVDTVSRRTGIDTVFAIDNSDLYVLSKDKSLKEIFASYNNGAGYKETFGTIADAIAELEKLYNEGADDKDYVVFPVAVSPYETGDDDNKTKVYQFNNEDDGSIDHHLVYQERAVREGDVSMMVPEGYGIAPFLKLQSLLNRLFEVLGYTVEYNFFEERQYYNYFVIVHNCADCLCNPGVNLYYADLVPSCTLSEFLEWLLAKFMVQPIVNSESKRVRIERINDLLNYSLAGTGGYDMDMSGLLDGDWDMQLNPSKRLVLRPTNELEGTEPAAETLDELVANYGPYVKCGETSFATLTTQSPVYYDCCVLRLSTGEFYVLERELATGDQKIRRIGTNHFTYDRKNSEDVEEHSQDDLKPLMFCDEKTKATYPFIGERIHRHTSYNGNIDNTEQKIIVVQATTNAEHFRYPTSGTTQDRIYYADSGADTSFWVAVADNYDMYDSFYRNYNKILLNNPLHLTGRLRFTIDQFLNMNMAAMKLFKNQRLIPVKASASFNSKTELAEAEYIKADYIDAINDSSPATIQSTPLKWNMTSESDEETGEDIFNNTWHNTPDQVPEWTYISSELSHGDFKDTFWLGTPKTLGETKSIDIMVSPTIKLQHYGWHDGELNDRIRIYYVGGYDEYTINGTLVHQYHIGSPLTNVLKTYSFVAVSAS